MPRKVGLSAIALCAIICVRLWAAPAAGEVVFLDGDVTIDGREAVEGQPVGRGATIRTGAASICEIAFGADNIIQVRAETTLVLRLGRIRPGFRLWSGSIAAVLNKVSALSPRGKLRVKTRSAVAGIRGTVFFVKIEDAAHTYVCACNGELGVTPRLRGEVELSAEHHVAQRFTRLGLGARSAPAALLYHDDAMMQALASKIGYSVPWGTGGYGR